MRLLVLISLAVVHFTVQAESVDCDYYVERGYCDKPSLSQRRYMMRNCRGYCDKVEPNRFPSWHHADCTFPFHYKGTKYEGCTKVGGYDTPWCGNDKFYRSGRWEYCEERIEANAWPYYENEKCTFPFVYAGTKYMGCTKANGHSTPWCSHDAVYSGGWSYCEMEQPTCDFSRFGDVRYNVRGGSRVYGGDFDDETECAEKCLSLLTTYGDMNAARYDPRYGSCYCFRRAKQVWSTSVAPGTAYKFCAFSGCNEYYMGNYGDGYRGCQTKTESGANCKSWTNLAWNMPSPSEYPNAGLDGNFCRSAGPFMSYIFCVNEETGYSERCRPLA